MPRHPAKKSMLLLVYLASFLYSFHYALPLYIESSFIAQFLSTEEMIGVVFSIAAIISVVSIFFFPRVLRKFGNYRTTLAIMGLEIVILLSLVAFSIPIVVVGLFIVHQALLNLIFLNLDTFVESYSNNQSTGGIRGIFMTVLNIAIAIAPFLAGLMLTDHDFWKVYLAGAIFMTLCFLVIAKNFKNYIDPQYLVPRFKDTIKTVLRSHDLHSVIFLHFLLAFFFSWMVIYTPIYLNKHIGIPMSDILSIIIPVALLPFIFFEALLGRIADAKLGEKEIVTGGFLLMAVATMGLSWITSTSVAVWAIALLITRIGASAVESMIESYFYKKVGPEEINLVTFMRMMRGSAYIVGPLLGSLVLSFINFRFLFFTLGIIVLTSIPYTLTIKDTK